MPPKKPKVDETLTEHEQLANIISLTQGVVKDKDRVMFGDDPRAAFETISTDVMEVDRILGGGWKLGRMGMVIGEATMGKTLLMQWTIAAFQKRGHLCGFMDTEHTFDAEWFSKTGVDVSKLIVFRPAHTEQAFDVACVWVENNVTLVCMDSVAALVPKMRTENTLEEREVMGLSARKLNEGIMQLNNVNKGSFILYTNQMRSKIGVVYGSPDTIPGGKAQEFMMSYIVRVRRSGWLPDTKDRKGYKVKFITEKNKLMPPFMEGEVPFMFTGVIDTIGGLIELAKEFDCVNLKSGYFRWGDHVLHGHEAFKKFLEDNEDVLQELKDMVAQAMEAVLDPESEVDVEYNSEDDVKDLITLVEGI